MYSGHRSSVIDLGTLPWDHLQGCVDIEMLHSINLLRGAVLPSWSNYSGITSKCVISDTLNMTNWLLNIDRSVNISVDPLAV